MTAPPQTNLRQAHWGLIDQALWTGNNFVLTFVVVRSVPVSDFGAFSLVYLLYVLAVGALRVTCGNVLTIGYGGGDGSLLLGAARRASTYAIGVGAATGALLLLTGLAIRGETGRSMAVLAVALPALLLYDGLRSLFFAQARPRRAVACDATWTAVELAVMAALVLLVSDPSAWQFLAAWACGGAAALLLALRRSRVRPAAMAPHRWAVANRKLAAPLFGSFALNQLPVQLAYVLMPLVSSLHELGVVRAAYVFFGPLGVVFSGASTLALPDAVRLPGVKAVRRLTWRVSLALGAIGVAWGLAIVVMPAPLGRALIGPVWDSTAWPRALLAGSLVAEGVLVGAGAALSALKLPERMMRVWLLCGPAVLIVGLGLSWRLGAPGMAAGLCLSYALAAVLAWWRVPRDGGGRW